MPYLRGDKLTEAQRATIGATFDASLVYFVCNDGSISKRHVPRIAPLDDHDISILLVALRYYQACPHRDMLGPDNTTSEHVAAIMQYIEGLR